jgi:site-specific DNA-methyltransferase (adenine-specific)
MVIRTRELLKKTSDPTNNGIVSPIYSTQLGALFKTDCLKLLPKIKKDKFDMIFADPPFNIGKLYGRRVNDKRTDDEYFEWCGQWINECIRILKPGGSFFIYNMPSWNIRLANLLLSSGMQFRHWIVVDVKLGLPIRGRLYPSHYSLLYFTKGKHKTFHNVRTPIKTCRHCGKDVKDYGGHRKSINPKGVNLSDVWSDIPPVRHWKFKSRKRKANALSTKLLERVVGMSTNVGDLILDPFGGSGTTFAVCEKLRRKWIGIEIESAAVIVERLQQNNLQHYKNEDLMDV